MKVDKITGRNMQNGILILKQQAWVKKLNI